MSADWVPFHRRLARGPKRNIPREFRFVLLELSLEARSSHGVLDLPVGVSTVEAVQDLLGGDRRQVRKAIEIFSLPDESGVAPLEIEQTATSHRLVITKWNEWAAHKTSTPRVRAHRERNKNGKLDGYETFHETDDAFHDETGETPTVQDSTKQNRTGHTHKTARGVDEGTPEAQRADVAPHVPAQEPTYDLAWRLWREMYESSKRRYGRYIEVPFKDEKVVQQLAHAADELTGGDRAKTDTLLRYWIASYLRDDGEGADGGHLARGKHRLSMILNRLPTYGEPRTKHPTSGVRKASTPPGAAPSVAEIGARAQATLASLARHVGVGGGPAAAPGDSKEAKVK